MLKRRTLDCVTLTTNTEHSGCSEALRDIQTHRRSSMVLLVLLGVESECVCLRDAMMHKH